MTEVEVAARKLDPDRLAELEEERRFLLQSLRDLDREYEAGDVDEHDYRELRDDYTVRAATVLRAIESGRSALPQRPTRRWGRTLAIGAAVVVVGAGIGALVASSSGQRLPGQELSGATPGDGTASLLVAARAALTSDPRAAAELYSRVLDQDPNHPEALAYSGWLSVLVSRGSADPELQRAAIDGGTDLLRRSIEADPSYADPHCLLAVVAARFEQQADNAAARREGRRCLALDPPDEMRGLVEEFVANL
jgi:hypothetical protein